MDWRGMTDSVLQLNPRVPFMPLILPVAALFTTDAGEGLDQHDLHDIPRLLTLVAAQAETKGCAVRDIQRRVLDITQNRDVFQGSANE